MTIVVLDNENGECLGFRIMKIFAKLTKVNTTRTYFETKRNVKSLILPNSVCISIQHIKFYSPLIYQTDKHIIVFSHFYMHSASQQHQFVSRLIRYASYICIYDMCMLYVWINKLFCVKPKHRNILHEYFLVALNIEVERLV